MTTLLDNKLMAFTDGISKDLPYYMLVGLKNLELNDNIPTIIKNLKFACKHTDKFILKNWLGICFNYSRYFTKEYPNDDFYDISNHCSKLFSDMCYFIPDDDDIPLWEGMNRTYRIQYIHWVIKQLKLAHDL